MDGAQLSSWPLLQNHGMELMWLRLQGWAVPRHHRNRSLLSFHLLQQVYEGQMSPEPAQTHNFWWQAPMALPTFDRRRL